MCVKAELISTRLLSEEDKKDMLDGSLTDDVLLTAVKAWRDNGMRDYSNGNTAPLSHDNKKVAHHPRVMAESRYRRPFKR